MYKIFKIYYIFVINVISRKLIYLKLNTLILHFDYYIYCKDSYVLISFYDLFFYFFIYISTIYEVTIAIAILYYTIQFWNSRVFDFDIAFLFNLNTKEMKYSFIISEKMAESRRKKL